MKTFFRVFTVDKFFDFPSANPAQTTMGFVMNGRIDGGFASDLVFVPIGEMKLVIKIQAVEAVQFMTPAGQA